MVIFSYTEYSADLISLKSQYEFQKLVAGYQEIDTLVPNIILKKPENFYTNPQYGGVKNFAYVTSSVGELSNHYKTILLKNYHTAPFPIKKGIENMINLTEYTYGVNVYRETKEEMDILYKFKFIKKIILILIFFSGQEIK